MNYLKVTMIKACQRNVQPISSNSESGSHKSVKPAVKERAAVGNSNSFPLPPILIQSPVRRDDQPITLGRLLVPPMAAVSYIVTRSYSDSQNIEDDVFWRPRSRIPDGNWKENLKMKEEFGRDAKYLLLSFDDTYEKNEESKREVLSVDPVVSKP